MTLRSKAFTDFSKDTKFLVLFLFNAYFLQLQLQEFPLSFLVSMATALTGTNRDKPTQRQDHEHHEHYHHGHCHCSSNNNKIAKKRDIEKSCSNFLNQSLKRQISWFYLKSIIIKTTTYNENPSIHKCQRIGKCPNQVYPRPEITE